MREPIVFRFEGYELDGTLHKPVGDGPFRTILVLHGASAGKQDHPQYLNLAQTMNQIGVAVLVHDRRGENNPLKHVHFK